MSTHTRLNSLLNRGSGLLLGLALVSFNCLPTLASEKTPNPKSQQLSSGITVAQSQRNSSPLADGIYLYGQSPQPEQLGQEYLVIRVNKGQVVGAFYMPQSEFNCFYGSVNAQQMSLSVVDPYDNTVHPYTIALQTSSPVAAQNPTSVALTLEGYHQVSKLSDNDQRILNVCLEQHL